MLNAYDKIDRFLETQKEENQRLDIAEGLTGREESGFDWRAREKDEFGEYSRPIGLRQAIYENTLAWIRGNLRAGGLLEKEVDKLNREDYLREDTLSTAAPTFTTALLPAVRRIYAKLLALDLVSVQPLPGPTGYIYWIDHTFGTTGGGATAGQRLDQRRHDAYAASSEQAATIRDINLGLSRLAVSTYNYKLMAKWTIEAEQDFRSQWKVDVEGELTPQLLNEIAREIDGLIIAALFAGVGYNRNWSRAYPVGDTAATTERKAYDATIYDAIVDAATEIYKRKKVQPSWLLFGPDVFARLVKLNNFVLDPTIAATGTADFANLSRRFVGTLNGLWKCYVDADTNNTPANEILLGIRGDWLHSVGYYAPYIPLFLSAKYMINDDFTQFARGAMTRFAYGIIPETARSSINRGLAKVTITAS